MQISLRLTIIHYNIFLITSQWFIGHIPIHYIFFSYLLIYLLLNFYLLLKYRSSHLKILKLRRSTTKGLITEESCNVVKSVEQSSNYEGVSLFLKKVFVVCVTNCIDDKISADITKKEDKLSLFLIHKNKAIYLKLNFFILFFLILQTILSLLTCIYFVFLICPLFIH